MDVVVAAGPDGVHLVRPEDSGTTVVAPEELPARVAELEHEHPRWVWADTAVDYPPLLRAGVRVARCHDLRLGHAILRHARLTAGSALATAPPGPWDLGEEPPDGNDSPTLLDALGPALGPADVLAEHHRQRQAVTGCAEPGRLALLLAAESVGALAAAEMSHDGLPFSTTVHGRTLADLLGPRPAAGHRPARLEELADEVRGHLVAPALNPDSPAELLRALRSAGLDVRTTRKEELSHQRHPAVAPLLEYKRLARLLAANGWTWMDSWVQPSVDGRRERFRPEYVPGGVVTGRWAARGGGALQLPKQIRSAVVADPGWRLVVADAAQLEPRVLAAMSRDEAMARAAQDADLYQGLVDQGVVESRARAKVAMLGALYGAGSGEAGALVPRLRRAYPRAMELVEHAARQGELGEQVSTWLGRTSPPPPEQWLQLQRRLREPDADPTDRRRAQQQARDRGRFTRNFVVQGTAAEWALCWLADLRTRLRADERPGPAPTGPHLVLFLHDELVVHTPADRTDDVAAAVSAAAASAGRLLFGSAPVDFPLEVNVAESYAS